MAMVLTAPLPDEVLLHLFSYLDLSATVAALRVSRHWHELANDPMYPFLLIYIFSIIIKQKIKIIFRVWKRLCGEREFPKVDRRRFGSDWKRWYRCMVRSLPQLTRS
jgi:hypothetical protein